MAGVRTWGFGFLATGTSPGEQRAILGAVWRCPSL
jgi:hypothetical protein